MFYQPIWEYAGHKLVKRPDTPNYHIMWTRKGSSRVRRKSTGTSDLETAKARLISFVQERATHSQRRIQNPVLLHLLAEYVDRLAKKSSRWIPEIGALKQWTRFCDLHDIVYVDELTRAMQDRYVEWRFSEIRKMGRQGSNATVNRDLRTLRAALNDAWREEILERQPRIISLSEPKYRQEFLFPEEVERLLTCCREDYLYRFVMIALHTLQRPGAVVDLHRDQVDLRTGRIDFLPDAEIQTRKRKPVVRISKTLKPVLEEAIEESCTGYLIERHGRPVQKVQRGFRAARIAAGLGDLVTPYTLRHTGATLLLAAGVPIRQVAGMLGHTVLRTTEEYGKHAPEFMREAADALDQLYIT